MFYLMAQAPLLPAPADCRNQKLKANIRGLLRIWGLDMEQSDVANAKLKWLKRHYRDCNDLYGMLSLLENMPVALTDHLDLSLL